jgi:acetate kinase
MQPILVLNAGSSSLKYALYDGDRHLEGGVVQRIAPGGHAKAMTEVLDWAAAHLGGMRPAAIGHRIVHGGDRFVEPAVVTPEMLAALEAYVPLAPLHEPHNLAGVRAAREMAPGVLQVACFDTAFHADQPRLATLFGLPRRLEAEGVRRYGFHGLSYEHIAGVLKAEEPDLAAGRVIVCHLGAGASLCAIAGGRSVASTMGFSALEGLVMATRCGSLDPGVVLHLLEQRGMTPAQVRDMLYKDSGLLGVSGLSGDMRDLTASDRPEAAEAVALFCYRIAREIGSLVAALGGLDGLVFTAGIGEHSPPVRAAVVERCAWLGARLDAEANGANARRIDGPQSRLAIRVIPTDEEGVIARHSLELLDAQSN